MAPTRSQSKDRQFKRRGGGVMKKADAIHVLIPGIKAAVLFLDGADLWTYESEIGWVSSLPSMTNLRLEQMNPSHFRTVFEHQQALTRAGELASAQPDESAMPRASESAMLDAYPRSPPLPPSTPEPTLFVSPSTHETSPPSSPSSNEMMHLLLSSINSDAPSSPIAQRRSTRTRKTIARRNGNATGSNKKRVGDIYGFMDVNDGGVDEM